MAQTGAAQKRGFWITIAILCTVVGYIAWRITAPYAQALLTGFALAAAFYPMYLALERRTGRPSRAALLSTLIVVVLVLVPVVFLTITMVRELQQGIQTLTANGGWSDGGPLRGWVDKVATRFGSSVAEVEGAILDRAKEGANALLKGIVAALGAATGGVLQTIVTIGAIHFGFTRGRSVSLQMLDYSPLGRTRTQELLNTTYMMVRASFIGIISVASAQGALLGIAAWIAGLPAPVLWGFATSMASVIPVVGSALVWVPGTILLLTGGKTGMAIFFLIWGAVVVANIDNVLRPLIMMASLPVSPVLIFVSIVGGIQAFGLLGILVGPVTLAVALALLKIIREEIESSRSRPPETVGVP